jgi:predicted metal-dependent peptidase
MEPEAIDTEIEKKVTKAKANILLDDPFYGYILLRHKIIQTKKVKTACINGREIKYNPDFVRHLSSAQLKGLLKHEVMHVAAMHHVRRGTRDPRQWNVAGDHMINNRLIAAGESIPDNGCCDPAYADFSTEHIFSILPEPPDNGDGDGEGEGEGPTGHSGWGDVEDHPDATDESSRDLIEQDTKLDIIQAYNTAKIQGKVPLGIESLVDKIRESKMPWRRILARFFRSSTKAREDWRRPNKRFLEQDIYLPTRHSKCLGPIVIGVDTSGSVSQTEMEAFFACVNGILKQTMCEAIHIVYCDAAVQHVDTLTTQDLPLTPQKLKRHGMGGTVFKPVFDYVAEKNLRPEVLLYMTDMYADFNFKPPAYPTIWCSTSELKAPWGQTIEISD